MPAQSVDVADINSEIAAWLPLNIQRRVHGVGEFIAPVIHAQVERHLPRFETGRVWQVSEPSVRIRASNSGRIARRCRQQTGSPRTSKLVIRRTRGSSARDARCKVPGE